MDFVDIIEFFKDIFKYIIVIVVVILINFFVVSIHIVVGASMDPNLKDSDILLLDKIIYKYTDLKRGNIISAEYKDTKYMIKRVIGIPGDKVEMKDNMLYINDQEYPEPYLNGDITEDFTLKELTGYDIIPEDMYFILGDNRNDSTDSRKFGLITKDDIIGKAIVRFWPINKLKTL